MQADNALRDALQEVEGVQHAVVDRATGRVVLVCDESAPGEIETAVRGRLAVEGLELGGLELLVSYSTRPDVQRRVRFESVAVEAVSAKFSVATVSLEWRGRSHPGRAQGEGGMPLELRLCALATIEALQATVASELTFQLVGIKAIRIFDHDLIAALLHSPQAADRRLIGTSLVLDDPHRSAAMAVLNATNRILGNYLVAE